MKKVNIIKKSSDFDRIINQNKPYRYKDYMIFLERIENNTHRFGLSVGKKVGNAVNRNKIKRRLKAIIDEKNYQNGFNCIIIVGKGINEKSFEEMKKNLNDALENLNIEERKDEKK